MRDFDPALTLVESAQVFHWEKTDKGYAALVNGRILTDADQDAAACAYFDDGRDYGAVFSALRDIAPVHAAFERCKGLRVVNQPAWEALFAFILSANNNVSRIRGLVRAFAREYGRVKSFDGAELFGIPDPETLAAADEAEMRERTHCGYRAPYIIGAARKVAEGFDLEGLRAVPTEEARARLMTLPGVGGKVADCVLLFGLEHSDAFPVDVWVARLMESWFHVTGSRERVRREAVRILGPSCGIIQQALFHAARTGKIDL